MSADGGARKDSRKDSNSAGGAQPHAAMQKPLYVLTTAPWKTPYHVVLVVILRSLQVFLWFLWCHSARGEGRGMPAY